MTGLAVVLAGCAVGPDYKKPQSWAPPQWQSGKISGTPKLSITVNDTPDPAWWNILRDPELTSLEQRVVTQNLDVERSAAQMAQSRAQMVMAGAERFPALSASGSYSRQQYSTKMLQRAISQVGKGLNGKYAGDLSSAESNASIPLLNQWQDGLDASWEVDLWGRVRRQYEAAKAYLDESVEQRREVLIARQAELASDYMVLRGAQEQLRVLRANHDTAAHMLALSTSRYKSGLVSELDVQSARSELDDTSSQIPQMEQKVSQQINAICLLMGAPPGALTAELGSTAPIPPVPPRVPVGVPSDLAFRRPDIRAADAQLHGATAEVGEAEADFYPKVTIDAGFGFESLSFRDLGFWNARAWNVGPSISLPIFEGGKLRGQLQLKKAAQKDAAIAYRKTVLTAWQEVDDAMTAYAAEQVRHDHLVAEVAANQRAQALATDRYRSGMVGFLDVLDAQRRVLSSELSLADSTTTVSSDFVHLYNVLGGGWTANQ